MKTDVLLAKLDSAREAIARAENDLKTAIAEIAVAPRAEKVAIGEALARAFEKLNDAKTDLLAVELDVSGKPR